MKVGQRSHRICDLLAGCAILISLTLAALHQQSWLALAMVTGVWLSATALLGPDRKPQGVPSRGASEGSGHSLPKPHTEKTP
jgi:hypothetical protein